ncbi:MAG: BatA domain-containing protein, partial [Myxococcota bacterium]
LAPAPGRRHVERVGSWTLLHPWLLTGLAGASLPILIHLIGRRRAPTVRFAAFDFLLAVNKRLARRERLRQILLLLMRTLAVIAIALAVARPMPSLPAAAPVTNRRLVLIFDTSASMGYVHDGTTLLERGKQKAREILSHVQPGDSVALILAGREVTVPFDVPTLDVSAVREAIDAVVEPAGVANLGAAIDRALSMLGGDGNSTVLVIVSDLSANSFMHLQPTAIDPPPDVRLVDVADREGSSALANLGIEAVSAERSADSASERRFRVWVRNYGGSPVSGSTLELLIDDRVTQRGYIDVPARGSAEKTLTQTFDGPGVYTVTVRLAPTDPGGYTVDDSMSMVTAVVPGVSVLAVNGDPRTTPYEDELFFVERALEAIPKGDAPIRLQIVTLTDIDDVEASGDSSAIDLDIDVVLLANVGKVTPGYADALRQFVNDGGGLLIATGNRVRFEAANAAFGDLLAHPLRDMHRAADPDAGTLPLGIGDMDWDHPILQGLGLRAEESLRASRTATYFNVRVGAGVKTRIILRYDNGAPALIERPLGKGRVMLMTTSMDVDLSDLALRSAFPALLQRTVRYLAHAVETTASGDTRVGGSVELQVPTGARALALIAPSGARQESTVADGGSGRVRFSHLGEVGIHRVEVRRGDEWQRAPQFDVAVNPSLDESDFLPIRAQEVARALGGQGEGVGVAVAVGTGQHSDPFEQRGAASYLLIALGLLFIAECLLASRG